MSPDISSGGVALPDDVRVRVMQPGDSTWMHWATVEMHDLLTTTDYSDDEIIDDMEKDWVRRVLTLAERRLLRARLAALRRETGQPPARIKAPGLPRGRRRLTDEQVGADIDRALATLAERRIVRPTWEQLAAAHDGLDWAGMSGDGLRKRRKQHPDPFREKVPHLTTE